MRPKMAMANQIATQGAKVGGFLFFLWWLAKLFGLQFTDLAFVSGVIIFACSRKGESEGKASGGLLPGLRFSKESANPQSSIPFSDYLWQNHQLLGMYTTKDKRLQALALGELPCGCKDALLDEENGTERGLRNTPRHSRAPIKTSQARRARALSPLRAVVPWRSHSALFHARNRCGRGSDAVLEDFLRECTAGRYVAHEAAQHPAAEGLGLHAGRDARCECTALPCTVPAIEQNPRQIRYKQMGFCSI
eukprot:SAG11_NODE_4065_length_2082_cov_1.178013_3_plen_249_part_00